MLNAKQFQSSVIQMEWHFVWPQEPVQPTRQKKTALVKQAVQDQEHVFGIQLAEIKNVLKLILP